MTGIMERNRQKDELASIGFSLKYVDEWQPKTTLYRHKPSYNVNGDITEDVGTLVKGVPGSPDYVLRKAKIGLFPWLPGDVCTCRWCLGRRGTKDEVVAHAEVAGSPPISDGPPLRRGSKRFGPHFKQS
jgi:hypothetical protein